jgi:adenylate cyclase
MDSSKTSMTWSRPLSLWLAPALLLALGVAAILTDSFGIETGVSDRLFDAYQRHAARPFADHAGMQVWVLELPSLDEDSLVKAVRTLSAQGAAMIVLTAPMQQGPSPQSLAARLPPGSDAARAALAKLPEPGHDLAAAIADTKAVVPVMLGLAGREPHIKARFVYRGTRDPFAFVPRFDAAAAPPALLETNAAGSAAANLTPDGDGVVRRMPVTFRVGAALVPGMAAEVLRVAAGKPDITVISNEHDPLSFLAGVGIAALETKNGPVATDDGGRLRLHYAANVSERMLSPSALGPLQGAIVVVGAAGQVARTPLGPASAANVVAESIENLIGNTVLSRPGWARPLEALVLAALGTAMIALLRFGLGWAAALVMAGALLLGLGSWYFYTAQNLLVDAATPSLFLGLAFAAGALAWIQDLRLAYARLRMAFSASLPRAAIEKIARRPHLLKLEGETRTVTYLVCGVRGLAGLAADFKNDAAGFTSLMQRALTPLIDQALAHGGTIDRLTADGFAAFWNAPLDDADHAMHACEAANGMAIMSSRVIEELAQQKHGEEPLVAIGVGIATGSVIAGGFDGYGRMGYSVHGDAVSLAQRLQALSDQYGPALIAADETRRAAERGFAFLEIDTIAMGAKAPPTTLYAILGNPVAKASPKFRALTVFHDHIFQAIRKQHWQMARDLIAQCRRLSGASQQMYDLHLARIAYYEKHPPEETWDGAFRPILE